MRGEALEKWHAVALKRDLALLKSILAADVVFHSPVVHTPQQGKDLVILYLTAAFDVLANPSFRYVREVEGKNDAVLDFETEVDGIHINGVDMIKRNSDDQIIDFKVMIRPLKAINLVHAKMAAMLDVLKGSE